MGNSSDLFFDSSEVSFDSSEEFFISYLGNGGIPRYLFGKFLGRNSILREEGVIRGDPYQLGIDTRTVYLCYRHVQLLDGWL